MDFSKFLQSLDLSNFQIDYSQMQISFLSDILNSDFLGFNTLDYPIRILILIIAVICIFVIGKKLFIAFIDLIKKIFKILNLKYERLSEKGFNTLVSQQLNHKLVNSGKFIIICGFNFRENDNRIKILTDFTNAFLINNTANVKYEKSAIIYTFDDFHKIINNVITQLYLTKTIFEQKYANLEINLSAVIVEKDSEYENQIDLVKSLNNLSLSKSSLSCDSVFNFYYSLIKPQLYELQSYGEYLIQNKTVEAFIMTKPVDRTL